MLRCQSTASLGLKPIHFLRVDTDKKPQILARFKKRIQLDLHKIVPVIKMSLQNSIRGILCQRQSQFLQEPAPVVLEGSSMVLVTHCVPTRKAEGKPHCPMVMQGWSPEAQEGASSSRWLFKSGNLRSARRAHQSPAARAPHWTRPGPAPSSAIVLRHLAPTDECPWTHQAALSQQSALVGADWSRWSQLWRPRSPKVCNYVHFNKEIPRPPQSVRTVEPGVKQGRSPGQVNGL